MASTQPTLRCAYRYDPLDQLINQTQPEMPAGQRFYCRSRLVTEIQGAIRHSIVQHDDLLLAQQQRRGDILDSTLLATDLQRSVLHTLKSNQQRQPIAYCTYGHHRAESGLTNLLGFNGEQHDPVTGNYLLGNGYRAFNPVLMRFNSPDSWSPFGKGGLNAYVYCLADPVNQYDQSGHAPKLQLFRFLLSKRRAITAVPSQKNGHMREIRMIDDAAFTFIDDYKGSNRLNIKAHGEPSAPGETSKIAFKNRKLTPDQLHAEIIKNNYDIEKFHNIKILACHSAEGGSNSFAAKFSQLTGKPVKGYKGVVVANNDPQDILEQFNYSRQHFPDDPYSDMDSFFQAQIHHIKKGKSISFYPKKATHIRKK